MSRQWQFPIHLNIAESLLPFLVQLTIYCKSLASDNLQFIWTLLRISLEPFLFSWQLFRVSTAHRSVLLTVVQCLHSFPLTTVQPPCRRFYFSGQRFRVSLAPFSVQSTIFQSLPCIFFISVDNFQSPYRQYSVRFTIVKRQYSVLFAIVLSVSNATFGSIGNCSGSSVFFI